MVNLKACSLSAYYVLAYSLLENEVFCNNGTMADNNFFLNKLSDFNVCSSDTVFVSDVAYENDFDNYFYTDYVQETVDKGLAIYKKINPINHIEKNCYADFISAVRILISLHNNAKLIFKSDSVRLKFVYKNHNFIIDYDYGVNDSVFIMKDEDGNLDIKECSLDNILLTLESYFEEIPERITSAA